MTSENTTGSISQHVEDLYQAESRRIFATLVRLLGDFDLAEDALQDAFRAAMEQWPRDGIPENPRAWLISTGRFKAIDALRRRTRFDAAVALLAGRFDLVSEPGLGSTQSDDEIEDDRLRLIFTCCHPALPLEGRVALTLREVCGLTTEAIAAAFLITTATLAQRIVRAKAKIRQDQIPYQSPSPEELPERLEAVLQVVYLLFNEGYYSSSGDSLTRPDLSGEAIRLGQMLVELLPETEVIGLLALMVLHEARRESRTSPDGELVQLEHQDRSRWNQELMAEGMALVQRALSSGPVGAFTLQAAIVAVHAAAPAFDRTDWGQIVYFYDLLVQAAPSPVTEVNRAVAVGMRDGPQAGLALVDAILERGDLARYPLAHAARADLCRRLGRTEEARVAYRQALALTGQGTERRFLERQLASLDG